MSTDDHYARASILESALSEERRQNQLLSARIGEVVFHAEAEQQEHTRTLAELALLKEALKASEAERQRLTGDLEQVTARSAHFESMADGAEYAALKLSEEILERDVFAGDDAEMLADEALERLREMRDAARMRKRDLVEVEQTLWRIHRLVTGKDSVPGNYAECEREIVEAMSEPPSEFLRNVDCGDVFDRDDDGNPIGDDDAPTEPAAEKEPT